MIQRGGSVISVGPHPPWPDKPCPRTHQAADQRGQLQGQATPVPPRPPAGELSGPEDPGLGAPCRLEEHPRSQLGVSELAPMVTSMVHQSWTWGALQRRSASRGCYASLFAPPPPPGSPGVMERAERESLWVSSKRSSPKGEGAHCPGAERTRSSGKFPYNESPPPCPPPSWPPYLAHFDLCPWVGRSLNPCPNPSFQRVPPAQGSSPTQPHPTSAHGPPAPRGSIPLGRAAHLLLPWRGSLWPLLGVGGSGSSWPALWSGGLLCLVLKRQLRPGTRGFGGRELGRTAPLAPDRPL